jgi:ABC-type bacteriocin/lantibiotic exporter with double-glycine peptidase domain
VLPRKPIRLIIQINVLLPSILLLHQLRCRLLRHLEVLLLETSPLVTLRRHDLRSQCDASVYLHVPSWDVLLLVVLLLLTIYVVSLLSHVLLQMLVDNVAVRENVI